MNFKELSYPQIDEKLYSGVHESGLKVFMLPKKFTKSYAVIGTYYGSANDKFLFNGEQIEVPDGIAHFLEHKLFEKKDGTNAFDDYAATGASANAYTGFNHTCYLFSCTGNLKENLEILLSFVAEPYFTDENVEKEQGIITQEIRMYDDDPNWSVYFNLLKCLYSKLPIRKDIAGTSETIREITPKLLYTCYNAYYNPNNIILFIAGDVEDKEAISDIIDKYVKKMDTAVAETISPDEPLPVAEKFFKKEMSVPTPLFMLGYKDKINGITGRELLKKQVITEILLDMIFGKSSDLYQSLYNSGLINDSLSAEYSAEKLYSLSIIGGESPDPLKVRDEICRYIASAELSEEDFIRCKKSLTGQFLHALNNIESISNEFISSLFLDVNLLDYVDVCGEITFDEVKARFKEHFDEDEMALSTIYPLESK